MLRKEDRFMFEAVQFEGLLRSFLYQFTRNLADVDELLNETYTRLLIAGRDPNRPVPPSIKAFALTIARNLALDRIRRRKVVPIELVADLEELNLLDESAQVDEIVNAEQELKLLGAIVEKMPPRQRQAFTLRKVYGYSAQEIADRLRISTDTVNTHLANASRQLAQHIFDHPPNLRESAPFFSRLFGRARKPK